jgi:hypothetical protein
VFGTVRTLQLIITFTVITNIGVEGEIASMGWGTPEVDEMFQATLIGTIGLRSRWHPSRTRPAHSARAPRVPAR